MIKTVSILACVLSMSHINANSRPTSDLSVIANFLQEYVVPLMKSMPKSNVDTLRSFEVKVEKSIEKVIRKKLDKLKPFLQDNDLNNELENAEETVIIDFLPDDKNKISLREASLVKTKSLKDSLERFKQMRDNIEQALIEESTSVKVKDMVMGTIDEMTAELIGNQCTWKSVSEKGFRTMNDSKFERSIATATKWFVKFEKLKTKYFEYFKNNSSKAKGTHKKLHYFIDKFNEFFSVLMKDLQNLSKVYKIRCQLINKNNNRTDTTAKINSALREHSDLGNVPVEKCPNFKVCSIELQEFMVNFYNKLNDTVVNTFRNYAEMYKRDVNTESIEKEPVVTAVQNLSNTVESYVTKIFKKITKNFKLDKHKAKAANINAIEDYITNTIGTFEKVIKHNWDKHFESLKLELVNIVQKDIQVNLDLDIGHLEREMNANICPTFSSCNGKSLSRRQGNNLMDETLNLENDEVYVKLQVDGHDDFDDIALNSISKKHHFSKETRRNYFQKSFRNGSKKPEYTNFNVTRTTESSKLN